MAVVDCAPAGRGSGGVVQWRPRSASKEALGHEALLNIGIPVAVVTVEGRILLASRTMTRMADGFPGTRRAGRSHLSDLLPAEIVEATALTTRIQQCVSTARPYGPERVRFMAPGMRRLYRYSLTPLPSAGAPTNALLVFEDITEMSRLVRSYQELTQVTDRALSSIPAALAVFTGQGILRWASPHLCALLDEDLSSHIGHHLTTLKGMAGLLGACGISLPDAIQLARSRLEPLEWSEVPCAIEGASGRYFDVALVELDSDQENRDTDEPLLLLMLIDVTVRVRASKLEERMKGLENLTRLGEVVAGVAREISTPLCIISGNAQHLSATLAERPLRTLTAADWNDVIASVGSIATESERCSSLVTSLVALSHQGPHSKQVSEPVEISRLMDRVLRLYEPELDLQGIRIVRQLADPSPVVRGDPWQMRQVLLNLMHSALNALSRGDVLTVGTGTVDGVATVTLRDSVPPDRRPVRELPTGQTRPRHEVCPPQDLGLLIASLLAALNHGTIDVIGASEPGERARGGIGLRDERRAESPDSRAPSWQARGACIPGKTGTTVTLRFGANARSSGPSSVSPESRRGTSRTRSSTVVK
ncbi:MAG: PAS domain-containing protein [Candidatus Riflebacteria bacterium]|nr:PAS domain-containing protein [Candidatus Riflebacteria bacterium]